MITMRKEVGTLLLSAGVPVYYRNPAGERVLPLLCYSESANRVRGFVDGAEYMAELIYTVDIYARTAEGAAALSQTVDARLAAAGFRRLSSRDLFDSGSRLVTMRYRAMADRKGNIYQ